MNTSTPVALRPYDLSPEDVVAVARHGAPVIVPEDVLARVAASRRHIEALAEAPRPVYGVSTGFGALAAKSIPQERRRDLQRSLIRSHAAGMGAPVEDEVVRALMLLRARTLATARTGVRPEVLTTMVALLNAAITPVVHEHGSLGCSGDLAPLSHCALVLMGEGVATGPEGRMHPAGELLAEAGIEALTLEEKEGLALINGTDGMLGMLLLSLADLDNLLAVADITASLSVEVLMGTDRVFQPDLHAPLRPHPGQAASADAMARLLADSPLIASHRSSDHLVQDAYSLRCAPQVTGAARDARAYARQVAERELVSAIDNPVLLADGSVSSNGNFHGAPLAHALDFLAIVTADVASMAERRTDRMMDAARSHGLPPFLAHDPGVDSGLMIAHYTQAALVSEAKRLAVPASVDSIPSSAMQEDHVSMGWAAARKLRTSVENLGRVLAVELTAGARAADLRAGGLRAGDEGLASASSGPASAAHASSAEGALAGAVSSGEVSSPALAAVIRLLREQVPGPGPDRFLTPELEAVAELVAGGRVRAAAESVIGAIGAPPGAAADPEEAGDE